MNSDEGRHTMKTKRLKVLLPVLLLAVLLVVTIVFIVQRGEKKGQETKKSDRKRPTVLLILDGFGVSEQKEHNAIAMADTPD